MGNSGAFMLDGSNEEQAKHAPAEVWIDWSYWPEGTTVFEDLFTTDDTDEIADMKRKPVRYVRADLTQMEGKG